MNDKKERDIMAVYTKPVNRAFITSVEEGEKMLKNVIDPETKKRIFRDAERLKKQIVNKEDNVRTRNKT